MRLPSWHANCQFPERRGDAQSHVYVDWAYRAHADLATLAFDRVSDASSPLQEDTGVNEFFSILRHLDKQRALTVARDLLEGENLFASEVLVRFLRYHTEFGNKIVAIRVADEALADGELVSLLTAQPAGAYPSEWDQPGQFLRAVNEDPSPRNEVVANYIIADWPQRAMAHSADDDDQG